MHTRVVPKGIPCWSILLLHHVSSDAAFLLFQARAVGSKKVTLRPLGFANIRTLLADAGRSMDAVMSCLSGTRHMVLEYEDFTKNIDVSKSLTPLGMLSSSQPSLMHRTNTSIFHLM